MAEHLFRQISEILRSGKFPRVRVAPLLEISMTQVLDKIQTSR